MSKEIKTIGDLDDAFNEIYDGLYKPRRVLTKDDFLNAFMKVYQLAKTIEGKSTPAGAQWQKEREGCKSQWQLCPKCNGEGRIYKSDRYSGNTSCPVGYFACDVCGGAKILATPILPEPPNSEKK